MPSGNDKPYFPYEFKIKTDPTMFEMEGMAPGFFNRIIFRDSLINYYPYAEFIINDDAGIFTEDYLFTEGLNFKVEFYKKDLKKDGIFHNFYWSEHQLTNPFGKDTLSGPVLLAMASQFRQQDEIKSKSFQGNISSIVSQVITPYKDYKGIPVKKKISTTANIDYWYQGNQTDQEFIDSLVKVAFSPKDKNSPFYSFFNLKGEFFFVTADELLEQSPIEKLYFGLPDDEERDAETMDGRFIRIPTYQFLGAPKNWKNYQKQISYINKDGTTFIEKVKLNDKKPIGQNKVPIRKEYLNKIRDNINFGIKESKQDQMYKGWVNFKFINSTSFPYRMKFQLSSNQKLVAGKTVECFFRSAISEKNEKAIEYSGKWVILESVHYIDENQNAHTSIVIGKPTLNIYTLHPFYRDFF